MKWQGWALGEQALFFRQDEPDGPVGLFLQLRDQTAQVATFVAEDMAVYTQDFLEQAIAEVGRANLALVAKLDG